MRGDIEHARRYVPNEREDQSVNVAMCFRLTSNGFSLLATPLRSKIYFVDPNIPRLIRLGLDISLVVGYRKAA